ncbi:MAG: UvrD-helicase domain-containing protein, partial [Planctomycetales bacterium]
MSTQIEFISAGAGSGKTYTITHMLSDLLSRPDSNFRPAGVIATTFTKKAANELVERVRLTLAQKGQHALATQMGQARIGTVNSVCGNLLGQFAFEAGLSPRLDVLDEDASKLLFSQALDEVVNNATIRKMNALGKRLDRELWQEDLKAIVDLARANGIEASSLAAQATQSLESLMAFFPKVTQRDLNQEIKILVDQAIRELKANSDDTTKTTATYLGLLEGFNRDLAYETPKWGKWLDLSNKKPAVKSQPLVQAVADLAALFEHHPDLHDDLRVWTKGLYTIAADALTSYHDYKAQRGMIDFVDQERLLLNILDKPEVSAVLS